MCNYIDWSVLRYIDERSHQILHKSHCKKEQVLVTMAGEYLGRAAVYDKDFVCSSNQAIAKLTLKSKISPYYVSTFLNSKYGQNQIQRFKTITGQPNINMALIKSLIIPDFSYKLYEVIDNMVKRALEYREEFKDIYYHAESILEKELGYEDYVEPREIYSTKQFSEVFGVAERMDSEYYQKRYDDLFDKLGKINTCHLAEIVKIKKSIEPGSEVYCDDGVPFVRVSDLSKYGISEPSIKIPQDIVANIETLFLKQDTILLSKDGSVGIAYKVDKDYRMVTSSALLHLSVCSNLVLSDYLTLVLNSRVVQMQAERDSGGSIIQHWKPSSIEQISIPLLDIEKQKQLSDMVQKSFELRRQSEQILSKAIEMVEMAIEQGEVEALRINGQIDS